MITVLTALLGFLGPFVPELLKFFRERQDQAFELKRLELNAALYEKQHLWKMAEIDAAAGAEEFRALHAPVPSFGVQILDKAHSSGLPAWAVLPVFWLFSLADWFAAMIRPGVTAVVVAMWIAYKWGRFMLMQHVSDQSFQWYEGVVKLWDEQDWALLFLVLGHWFGQRAVKAVFGGNASHGGAGK